MRASGMFLAALALVLLAGCGSDKKDSSSATPLEPKLSKDPVTLTFYNYAGISDLTFQTLIEEPIKKKYPYITIKMTEKGMSLPDLVASGNPPDLIHATNGVALQAVIDLKLYADLTPLMKRHKFDLSIFKDGVIEDIRRQSANPNEIVGLPANNNMAALYYNKDIFDKFGVPYPRDGMTWDETYQLAKLLTRQDAGVAYRGFTMQHTLLLNNNQLSLRLLDPVTDKPLQNQDEWARLFQNWKRFFEISGNELTDKTYGSGSNDFLKIRNVAMAAWGNSVVGIETMNDPSFNWDMVTLPVFPEAPGVSTQMHTPLFIISPTTKHMDQAFQVVAEMFSTDVQLQSVRTGRPSLMKDAIYNQEIGTDLRSMAGKNKRAFADMKPASYPDRLSSYELVARTAFNNQFKEYLLGLKDLNTALRIATDQMTKDVEAEKAKRKN